MVNKHLIVQMLSAPGRIVDGPYNYFAVACADVQWIDKFSLVPTLVNCTKCKATAEYEQSSIKYELSEDHTEMFVYNTALLLPEEKMHWDDRLVGAAKHLNLLDENRYLHP